MGIDIITRAELDEWARKLQAQIQGIAQVGQGGEQIFYDNEALSRKLNVSKRTLQNWRDGGLIEFSQIGHKIYYTGEGVISFLRNRKVRF